MQALPTTQQADSSLLSIEYVAAQQHAQHCPLVLIRGWGNSSRCWQPLLNSLSRDRDLFLVDLPSCGKNTFHAAFSLDELLEALHACLPENSILLGWSLGGMLATRLAASSHKNIRGLITLACNPSFVIRDAWPTAMDMQTFADFYEGFKQNPTATYKKFLTLQALGETKRKQVLQQLDDLNPVPMAEQTTAWTCLLQCLLEIDNTAVVESLACPGLHIFAQHDALVPLTVAEKLKRYPAQQVQVLNDCGHALHLSHTEEAASLIKHFLAKLDQKVKFKERKLRVARAFSQAASSYDATAKLQRTVAETLVRMHCFETANRQILDLGCGTGFVSELLAHEQEQSIFLMDLSQTMLQHAGDKLNASGKQAQKLVADMDALPLAPETMDVVISSMSVQWSEDLARLLAQVWAALKPGGYLLFSTVGEATLHELAQAWRQVDDYVHVNSFLTSAEIQELARTQHFVCEDMRRELHIQYFADVVQLMKSLKAVGAHTVNTGNNHGLTSRARLQALQKAYDAFRSEGGLLPASWEILYFVLKKEF